MEKRELTITIKVTIEGNDVDDVRIETSEENMLGLDSVPPGWTSQVERYIDDFAPPSLAPFQHEFVRRCTDDGLTARPADGQRTYINVFPHRRFGAKRAAAFQPSTGRVEIYCAPANADDFETAEAVFHGETAVAVKVYLHSTEAVEQATELVQRGLAERAGR